MNDNNNNNNGKVQMQTTKIPFVAASTENHFYCDEILSSSVS